MQTVPQSYIESHVTSSWQEVVNAENWKDIQEIVGNKVKEDRKLKLPSNWNITCISRPSWPLERPIAVVRGQF
jgi:hypothetical protein